jgi:hypothetical protein
MIGKIFSTLAFKLLTEKVIIKVVMTCAEYLVNKSTNKLDDKLFKTIKEALS